MTVRGEMANTQADGAAQPHLDPTRAVGGSYIRNTMSDRHGAGFEPRPPRGLTTLARHGTLKLSLLR